MSFDSYNCTVLEKLRSIAGTRLRVARGTKEEIEIERHRLSMLVIYECSGDEIEQLEKETLSISEDLNFSIAGFSVGTALLVVLLTVDITSNRLFYMFFIACLAGYAMALYCGIKWWRGRKSFTRVMARIKQRVGPLGEQGKEVAAPSAGALPSDGGSGTP
jgi:hypothetical protein